MKKKRIVSLFTAVSMIVQVLVTSVAFSADKVNIGEERSYIKPMVQGAAPKIFLASDSTCEDLPDDWFPREGWGMEIGKFFNKDVKIVNKAKGGKSTRSFLNNWDAPSGVYDTRMNEIEREAKKGDWLFVQFGHNDFNNGRTGVPTDSQKTDDEGDYTSYRKNLERFIDFADKNKLNIAFLTSIHVLTNFSEGELGNDGIESFRQAMREVGAEYGVPVLDVGNEHKKLVESLGDAHARDIYMFVDKKDYPKIPDSVSLNDTTHINQTGAIEVSKIVTRLIKEGADNGTESLSELYKFIDHTKDLTPISFEDTAAEPTPPDTKDSYEEVSLVPGKNNAYVIFGDKIQKNSMEFVDGTEQGISDSANPLYNEKVKLDGVSARKMYAANVAYLNLSKDYYQEGDHRFLVMITYYDFGPDVGYFYFDYNSNDPSLSDKDKAKKRITITKPGIVPKWSTVRLYINDADFNGMQDFGADMSLVTRTYNAWAKIEIVNVDALERNQAGSDIPVVNAVQAECLKSLKLYNSADSLEKQMTKREVLEETVKALGYSSDVEKAQPSSRFSNDEKLAKTITVAEEIGIIDENDFEDFEPDAIETVNDSLKYFLKYLKVSSDNNYEDAFEIAEKIKLITETDFVIFKANPVIRDNFVAMIYNALMLQKEDSVTPVIGELLDKGIFTADMLLQTGIPDMAAYKYVNPVRVPKLEYIDADSGRTYYYMNFDGKKAVKPYVSTQNWNYEGTKFIFGCGQTNAMYEYDIQKETIKFLDHVQCDGIHLYACVLPNNMIYYCKNGGLWKMDWNTGKKEYVANRSFSILSVTNDETYASGDYAGSNARGVIGRVNLKTGEFEEIERDLRKENPNSGGVNHSQINPGYPELNFFCNEGTTTLIPDRLWLANWDTGETYNMFIQAENADGTTGEPSGHEVWGMDGNYMYWVKFVETTSIGQTGLMRSDRFGNSREYINGDYKFWHCYPSGDDNWIAGDTSAGELVLVSTNSYQSYLLAKIRMYNWEHPYQPHPCISRNGASLNWQMVDDNNMLGIGWMDISDITSNTTEVEEIKLNDQVSIISYKDTAYYAEKGTHNGEECIIAPKRNILCCKINDDFLKDEDTNVAVEITYMDYGILPLSLKYSGSIKTVKDLANFDNNLLTVNKTGSEQWKTIVYNLDNANMANGGVHGSDFLLYSTFSKLIIKDIKIIKK